MDFGHLICTFQDVQILMSERPNPRYKLLHNRSMPGEPLVSNSSLSLDFLGGPVVKTPRFHCRGHRFDPWLRKFDMLHGATKKKKKIIHYQCQQLAFLEYILYCRHCSRC